MSAAAYDAYDLDLLNKQCFLLHVHIQGEPLFDAYLSKDGIIYLFVGPPPWYVNAPSGYEDAASNDQQQDPRSQMPTFKYADPYHCMYFEKMINMWDVIDLNNSVFVNERHLVFAHNTPLAHLNPELDFEITKEMTSQAEMRDFYNTSFNRINNTG